MAGGFRPEKPISIPCRSLPVERSRKGQRDEPKARRVVLIRVGIDTGSGGMHGPLFSDGSFEYIPIPDASGRDERTYGNTTGRSGRPLVEFFPPSRRHRMRSRSMHFDPEFQTFTYGSPTAIQTSLADLERGDLLVFYGGLRPFPANGSPGPPAGLYLFGYLEVERAVRAAGHSRDDLMPSFGANFHVRHPDVFQHDRGKLVLVKGGTGSRLLTKAVPISARGQDRRGLPIHVLSVEMQEVFGHFDGVGSIQRCVPRWVHRDYVQRAAEFIRAQA